MQKRGALELSIGTIVVIVIAMFMLIFGIIFVRNIMCSGIVLTDDISAGVESEIQDLFGSKDFGVKCMGEDGQEARFGDGRRVSFFCVINSELGGTYNLRMSEITDEETKVDLSSWVVDRTEEWPAGRSSETRIVGRFDIPADTPVRSIKIVVMERNPDGVEHKHLSYIEISHVGTLTSAMC